MKIGFKTVPLGVDWPTLLATWELGDQLEGFDSGWLNDHFVARHGREGQHEAMTAIAAIASRTRRLTLGHAVLGNAYRHPVLLAKMVASLDLISEGRFVLGLGAGVQNDAERFMYGWPTTSIGERTAQLEETVQIVKGLWRQPEGYAFTGRHYVLEDARLDPACVTPGGPPVWLGTRGRQRGLRIVAKYADGLAATSDGWTPEEAPNLVTLNDLLDVLRRHCDEVQRDFASIEISVRILTRQRSPADLIAEAVGVAGAGANHLILSFAASSGPAELERLAVEVVGPLREQIG